MSWRKRPVPRHPPHVGRSRSQHPAGEAGAVLTKYPRPGSRRCFRKGRTGTVTELRRSSGASGNARAPGTEQPCAPLPADQHGLWRSLTLLPAAGGSEGPRPAEMSPALGFAPPCFSREPRRGESGLSEPRAPQASQSRRRGGKPPGPAAAAVPAEAGSVSAGPRNYKRTAATRPRLGHRGPWGVRTAWLEPLQVETR